MSKFVTLVLEPSFNDEYGEYANLPVFNAHGDVVGYTGGEVPEAGNPCEFYVMDEEGFPVCHSASENAKLRKQVERLRTENAKLRSELDSVGTAAYLYGRSDFKAENAKLRELLAGVGQLLFTLDVDYCAACPRDGINHPCPVYTVGGGECLYKTDMRELGVKL